MSLKTMMIKLAIAFAAAKGVQTYREQGGMEGVKRKLSQQSQSGKGLGGLMSAGGTSGGLGGILSQLGLNAGPQTGTGTTTGGQGGLGGILAGLAGATAGAGGATRMQGLLDRTRNVPEGQQQPDDETIGALMIRAMVQAAKADGEIDAQERAVLIDVIGDSDPEDRAYLDRMLAAPMDLDGLVRDVPPGMELETYTASVNAIDPDNRAEAEYLHALAEKLSLDKATVNQVHEATGKPPLYTL